MNHSIRNIKINVYYQPFQNTTFIKTCHRFCLLQVSLLSLTPKSSITTKWQREVFSLTTTLVDFSLVQSFTVGVIKNARCGRRQKEEWLKFLADPLAAFQSAKRPVSRSSRQKVSSIGVCARCFVVCVSRRRCVLLLVLHHQFYSTPFCASLPHEGMWISPSPWWKKGR